MEKESLRNGTAFTTMLTTMIWEILTRVRSMSAQFLVGLLSTLILVGEEQAEQQRNQVIILLRILQCKQKSVFYTV